MKRALTLLITALCTALMLNAQSNLSALMPMPNNITQVKGKPYHFVEGRTAIVCSDKEQLFVAESLASIIEHRTGVFVPVVTNTKKADITLAIDPTR